MTDQSDDAETAEDLADAIAELARDAGLRIAVAESLTSGAVASALGKAGDAGEWFSGGVVAYDESVKFDVLGVTPGPVVTGRCAEQMAVGVRDLLDVDIAVSLTGAGGPGAVEGQPPGTVFLGWSADDESGSYGEIFDGEPEEVVQQSIVASLRLILELLEDEDDEDDREDDGDGE
jgi:nicotinamide-nucleotide amidase